MFVIFKNEAGRYSVRPAFIGFIKHNTTRRILCTLYQPLTLIATIVLNVLQALIVAIYMLVLAVAFPIIRLRPIWKTTIWQRPRYKGEKGTLD